MAHKPSDEWETCMLRILLYPDHARADVHCVRWLISMTPCLSTFSINIQAAEELGRTLQTLCWLWTTLFHLCHLFFFFTYNYVICFSNNYFSLFLLCPHVPQASLSVPCMSYRFFSLYCIHVRWCPGGQEITTMVWLPRLPLSLTMDNVWAQSWIGNVWLLANPLKQIVQSITKI